MQELDNSFYDPQSFSGAQIGLQLSGRRYADEDVIATTKTIVDEVLKCDLFKWRKKDMPDCAL